MKEEIVKELKNIALGLKWVDVDGVRYVHLKGLYDNIEKLVLKYQSPPKVVKEKVNNR